MSWGNFLDRVLNRANGADAATSGTAAAAGHEPATREEAVRAALRSVEDPELGLNIVDLGLVYAVEATADRVRADITLTTPTCPLGETVAENARAAIGRALPDVPDLQVRLVWEPRWTPAMMSDDARRQLGW